MSIYLEKAEDVSELKDALRNLAGIETFEAYRFCDDFANEHKRYDVFKIVHPGGTCVLKQFGDENRREAEEAAYRLFPEGLPVPRLLGFTDGFMLMEFIPGGDLKEPSDEGVAAAAKSLAEIMNAFPFREDYDRSVCEVEIDYRKTRIACLLGEPLLMAAYMQFLERIGDMPLTLGNGDFVPLNCILNGGRVYVVDWEYSGFMPYALDIVRFIAHAGENAEVFPYRMTEAQKQRFVDTVYDSLKEKPARDVFDRDLRLALLDEYVMVLKYYLTDPDLPKDEQYRVYYERASRIAEELNG